MLNLEVVLECDPGRMLPRSNLTLLLDLWRDQRADASQRFRYQRKMQIGSRSLANFLFFWMGEARQWAGPPPRGSDDP
jgi:hypothetical protein